PSRLSPSSSAAAASCGWSQRFWPSVSPGIYAPASLQCPCPPVLASPEEDPAMPTQFLMLPPQSPKTREWGERLAATLPELEVVVAEDREHAEQTIATAEAAFGVIPPELLRQARRLKWLQAPQAAPPAGYYYPELIAHPVTITNFREIYNDHIGAHVMAFVLAF